MTSDIRSRYWTFLFDNLKRSIEQIYQTCQSDQNPFQCQEIVEYLSKCCQDFQILMKDSPKEFKQLYEHSQSISNGDDFLRRLKRFHNSDVNLTVNNRTKRPKSIKSRTLVESSSLVSLPTILHNDSTMTLVADSTNHYRTSDDDDDDDDDDDVLERNQHGMMEFMDRQIFDAFDQEESLTAALEAEQERTIASLMLEQEELEDQINNVSDDDGSEIDESELSTTKTSSYFMSIQGDQDTSLIDVSRDDNDSDPDGKSRTRHLRLHEKLSSPARVRPLSETLREAAERQARAVTKRQLLQDEKARKLRELTQRVNEVRQWKEELIKARKTTIEIKMNRAEEKRQYLLLLKAKKAGDEDLKGQEIAFIKCLQQENRRQTLKERYQKEEQFKQYLEEERVKKHDEHKQRELAAENRRKELETMRQIRLNEMQEKWKTKEKMIEQHLNEKRKQKQTAAIAKQKNFQQKRAERVASLKESTVELKKKLAMKQEESTRRHVTQLEEIRRKAIEMSTLRGPSAEGHHSSPIPDESRATTTTTSIPTSEEQCFTRKCCTLCNILLASDLHLQTHLRGTRHNQLLVERFNPKKPTPEEIETLNSECIVVVTSDDIIRQEMAYNRERKHAMKRRAKKLRLRIAQRSTAYESENAQRPYLTSTHKSRIQRFLNELEKSLNTTTRKEPLNTTNYLACQRILAELAKIFDTHGYEKDSPLEQRVFFSLNGYSILNRMIDLRAESNKPPLAPESLIALTISVYRAATQGNLENAIYLLNSGKLLTLIESFARHFNGFKCDDLTTNQNEKLPLIDLVTNLAETLADLFTTYNSLIKHDNQDKLTVSRLTDFISYMANIGLLDRIAAFFRTARAIANTTKSRLSHFICHSLNLLQQMLDFAKPKSDQSPFHSAAKKSTNDPAQVLSIMKSTNYCEILSLLYGILIYEIDNPTIIAEHPNAISLNDTTLIIATNSLILLNTIAQLDLDSFQTTLAEETISLQLRHVANFILAYCNNKQTAINDQLLHQIILLIGYYCVLNPDNQCRLAFGNRPTVLQQLSSLPFRYFVETKYIDILFPTLIAASYDCDTTRTILQSEMSLDLIRNFIQTKINDEDQNTKSNLPSFSMRFPHDEWMNALKYYQPITNHNEKENQSQQINCSTNS